MNVRPFVHASGAKQAWALSKEALRGIIVALGVAGTFKVVIDERERINISQFYKRPVLVQTSER